MSRSIRERAGLRNDESPIGVFIGSLLGDFTTWFVRTVAVLCVLDLWNIV